MADHYDENGNLLVSRVIASADLDIVQANSADSNSLTWVSPADNGAGTKKSLTLLAPANIATKYLLVATIKDTLHESDFTLKVRNVIPLHVAGTPRATANPLLTPVYVSKTVAGDASSGQKAIVIEGLFPAGTSVLIDATNDSNLTEQVVLDLRLYELQKA